MMKGNQDVYDASLPGLKFFALVLDLIHWNVIVGLEQVPLYSLSWDPVIFLSDTYQVCSGTCMDIWLMWLSFSGE